MKYKIITLGCKVNTYESEAVKQLLDGEGYYEEPNNKADIVLINTCSVTSVSDQKSRQKIRSAIKENEGAIIVAMGCYAQMAAEFLATIPGMAIIVGTDHRLDIPRLIKEFLKTRKQIIFVNKNERNLVYEPLKLTSYSDNTRAFLKIQDGCDNFCTYCIIPYSRGRMRSRDRADILQEVHTFVGNGFQEIVLTGIHTAGYGRDLDDYSFSNLLQDILKQETKLFRLRISSIEESEIDDDFLDLLKTSKIIAAHLHIPLQAGSDKILRLMNRKYDTEKFYQKLVHIRRQVPHIAITTDVIVGFPGETEEDYLMTLEFVQKCQFSMIHVFPFSPRSGTKAALMDGQVSSEIKKNRVHRLLELSDKLHNEYAKQFIGQELEVLIEKYDSKRDAYVGYTSNYLQVQIPSEENIHNLVLRVKFQR